MSCGIYQIKNLVNGKVYIGSAVNIKRRWSDHRKCLVAGAHHSAKLQNAWNKYGAESFDFYVLERVTDRALLIEREQWWLDSTQAAKSGYNISPTAYSLLGFKHTQAAKDKCRAAKQGKPMPAHVLEALRLANTGKKLSADHKAKISAAGRGRKPSAEAIELVAAHHRGAKRSAETRARISEAMKGNQRWLGRTHTDETKARISEAKSGKTLTPEHRAKISASQKGKPKPRAQDIEARKPARRAADEVPA